MIEEHIMLIDPQYCTHVTPFVNKVKLLHYDSNSYAFLFLERSMVRPRWQILYKLMLNWKEVSDGNRSQKTCEVGTTLCRSNTYCYASSSLQIKAIGGMKDCEE